MTLPATQIDEADLEWACSSAAPVAGLAADNPALDVAPGCVVVNKLAGNSERPNLD